MAGAQRLSANLSVELHRWLDRRNRLYGVLGSERSRISPAAATKFANSSPLRVLRRTSEKSQFGWPAFPAPILSLSKLQDSNGSVIEQGTIPASNWTSTGLQTWGQYTFSTPRTLLPGNQYFLEFSTASSSTYRLFPERKGVDYWFDNTTWWDDGYAQFLSNGSWIARRNGVSRIARTATFSFTLKLPARPRPARKPMAGQ